ncbi:hypothetical protein GGF37_003424, partial [Kickxella alabastrina]
KGWPEAPRGRLMAEDAVTLKRQLLLGQQLRGNAHSLHVHELATLFNWGANHYDEHKERCETVFRDMENKFPMLCEGFVVMPDGTCAIGTAGEVARAIGNIYHQLYDAYHGAFPSEDPCSPLVYGSRTLTKDRTPMFEPANVFTYSGYAANQLDAVHLYVEASLEFYENRDFPADIIGRLGERIMMTWDVQPLRQFVPVAFVHGMAVDILLFTREGYVCVPCGTVFDSAYEEISNDWSQRLGLLNFWYIMMQPAHKFGHIVNMASQPRYLEFSIGAMQAAKVTAISERTTSAVDISNGVQPAIGMRPRGPYTIKVLFGIKKKPATLKLCWTPVDSVPEGVFYDILAESGVPGIPEVLGSGVLVGNFLGYRFEFLVLKDIGESIGARFQSLANQPYDCNRLCRLMRDEIVQVLKCLVKAKEAGVFHRNLTPDNISKRNTTAFVSDWGCAKLGPNVCPRVKARVSRKWGLNIDNLSHASRNRYIAESMPCFASIRMLRGHLDHTILDDAESLLYVMTAAFSALDTGRIDINTFAFQNVHRSALAILKAGAISNAIELPLCFGVSEINTIRAFSILNPLHRLLFYHDNNYIGNMLLSTGTDMRTVSDKQICGVYEWYDYRENGCYAADLPKEPSDSANYSIACSSLPPEALAFFDALGNMAPTSSPQPQTSVFSSPVGNWLKTSPAPQPSTSTSHGSSNGAASASAMQSKPAVSFISVGNWSNALPAQQPSTSTLVLHNGLNGAAPVSSPQPQPFVFSPPIGKWANASPAPQPSISTSHGSLNGAVFPSALQAKSAVAFIPVGNLLSSWASLPPVQSDNSPHVSTPTANLPQQLSLNPVDNSSTTLSQDPLALPSNDNPDDSTLALPPPLSAVHGITNSSNDAPHLLPLDKNRAYYPIPTDSTSAPAPALDLAPAPAPAPAPASVPVSNPDPTSALSPLLFDNTPTLYDTHQAPQGADNASNSLTGAAELLQPSPVPTVQETGDASLPKTQSSEKTPPASQTTDHASANPDTGLDYSGGSAHTSDKNTSSSTKTNAPSEPSRGTKRKRQLECSESEENDDDYGCTKLVMFRPRKIIRIC